MRRALLRRGSRDGASRVKLAVRDVTFADGNIMTVHRDRIIKYRDVSVVIVDVLSQRTQDFAGDCVRGTDYCYC